MQKSKVHIIEYDECDRCGARHPQTTYYDGPFPGLAATEWARRTIERGPLKFGDAVQICAVRILVADEEATLEAALATADLHG